MKTHYFKALAAVLVVVVVGLAIGCSSDSSSEQKKQNSGTNTQTATETRAPSPSPATATPETEVIFQNFNVAAVANGPTSPTKFTITAGRRISLIQDYHWNSAKGKTPGTIGLQAEDGTIYGPWQAEGSPGQGGVPDAYWTSHPNAEIPAGTYTVVDSDPATWARNSGTNGAGMTMVYAVK